MSETLEQDPRDRQDEEEGEEAQSDQDKMYGQIIGGEEREAEEQFERFEEE